ncbi:UNVERIFIED_CONTAM: hypothetical protein K2H54_048643 [Gekko kuhli]
MEMKKAEMAMRKAEMRMEEQHLQEEEYRHELEMAHLQVNQSKKIKFTPKCFVPYKEGEDPSVYPANSEKAATQWGLAETDLMTCLCSILTGELAAVYHSMPSQEGGITFKDFKAAVFKRFQRGRRSSLGTPPESDLVEAVGNDHFTGHLGDPAEFREETYLNLCSHKNMKLKERVVIPVKQYPKFDIVGKVLGPQGNTIKQLQEETGAKISVLGNGSTRDKTKEEELRKGCDPKYAHLNRDLLVLIEEFGPPCKAYALKARAMEKDRKFLVLKLTKFRKDGDYVGGTVVP